MTSAYRSSSHNEGGRISLREALGVPESARTATLGRWPLGTTSEEGLYEDGLRQGPWKVFYEHGDVVTQGRYRDDKEDGVWISYSLRWIFAFATCLDRGRKVWEVTDEDEAKRRACP